MGVSETDGLLLGLLARRFGAYAGKLVCSKFCFQVKTHIQAGLHDRFRIDDIPLGFDEQDYKMGGSMPAAFPPIPHNVIVIISGFGDVGRQVMAVLIQRMHSTRLEGVKVVLGLDWAVCCGSRRWPFDVCQGTFHHKSPPSVFTLRPHIPHLQRPSSVTFVSTAQLQFQLSQWLSVHRCASPPPLTTRTIHDSLLTPASQYQPGHHPGVYANLQENSF